MLKVLKFGKIVFCGANILDYKMHPKYEADFKWTSKCSLKKAVPYNQENTVICFFIEGEKHQSSTSQQVVYSYSMSRF